MTVNEAVRQLKDGEIIRSLCTNILPRRPYTARESEYFRIVDTPCGAETIHSVAWLAT